MQYPTEQSNRAHRAPRNESNDFVARAHLESAYGAASRVRQQYSSQSKNQLIRECLHHLQAFLAVPRAGAAHE